MGRCIVAGLLQGSRCFPCVGWAGLSCALSLPPRIIQHSMHTAAHPDPPWIGRHHPAFLGGDSLHHRSHSTNSHPSCCHVLVHLPLIPAAAGQSFPVPRLASEPLELLCYGTCPTHIELLLLPCSHPIPPFQPLHQVQSLSQPLGTLPNLHLERIMGHPRPRGEPWANTSGESQTELWGT
jgi:hypothetical protein